MLSWLLSKYMKLGLLRVIETNPFDAAKYSFGVADHIYTTIGWDFRDLSALLPKPPQ